MASFIKTYKVVIGVFCSIFFTAKCMTTIDKQPHDYVGRAMMNFTIDGRMCQGTCTAVRRPGHTYMLKFDVSDDSIECNIKTCHRDHFIDCKRAKEYRYRQQFGVENVAHCPLTFTEFKKDGAEELAFVDFINGDKLRARVFCNGEPATDYTGGFMCQAAEGTVQQIWFDNPVVVESVESCHPPDDARKKHWQITVEKGRCYYVFFDGSEFFTLGMRGY